MIYLIFRVYNVYLLFLIWFNVYLTAVDFSSFVLYSYYNRANSLTGLNERRKFPYCLLTKMSDVILLLPAQESV